MNRRLATSGPPTTARGPKRLIPSIVPLRKRGIGTKFVTAYFHSLLPRLVSTRATPAEKRPYSAAYAPEITSMDSTASIGRSMPNPPVTGSVTLAALTCRPLCSGRPPFRLILPSSRRITPGITGSTAWNESPASGATSVISGATAVLSFTSFTGEAGGASTVTDVSRLANGKRRVRSTRRLDETMTGSTLGCPKPANVVRRAYSPGAMSRISNCPRSSLVAS